MLLDKIPGPADLRRLDDASMSELATEIRERIEIGLGIPAEPLFRSSEPSN